MKKLIATTAAALLATVAMPAMAVTTFNPASQVINIVNDSGIFGASTDELGAFSHVFSFTIPPSGHVGSSTVTTTIQGLRDIDFTSILLDSNAFTKVLGDPGETWQLSNVLLTGGNHTITLNGTKAGAGFSSYAGTLELGGVPEPAVWGMMLLGFGLVGSSMRSRKGKGTVVYA
jgi:hypothetical protein